MKIEEGWGIVQNYMRLRLSEYMSKEDLTKMRVNKGKAGKLIEKAIGLPDTGNLKDFEDGELKTYKANDDGSPLETMAIHQLSNDEIDFMIERGRYEDSLIHKKVERLIVLGICKEAENPSDWGIVFGRLVDCRIGTDWFYKLKISYNKVNEVFLMYLTTGDKMFHTSSGEYMQIRTKDSEPYTPRFSKLLEREICNKRIAFYFQKNFMKELLTE